MLKKISNPTSIRLRSFLSALIFIFSIISGSFVAPLALQSTAYAAVTTQAQCQALGDTWYPADATNHTASCVGPATCAMSGGVWNPADKSCVYIREQFSSKMTALGIDGRAKSYAYYKAVYKCVDEFLRPDSIKANIDTNGTDTSPLDGYWYGDGPSSPDKYKDWGWWLVSSYTVSEAAFMGNPDAGCSQLTADALKFWGLGTPGNFLVAMGYKYDGGKQAWALPGGKKDMGVFTSYIEKAGYTTSLSNDVEYSLNLTAFNSLCQAKLLGDYNSLSSSRQQQIDSYNRSSGETPAESKVTQVNSDGTALVVNGYEHYLGPKDAINRIESQWPIYAEKDTSTDTSSASRTCFGMVDTISNNAPAALTSSLLATCSASGYTLTNDVNTCMAALQFKSITTFCDTAYNDNPQANSICKKSQGLTPIDIPSGSGAVSDSTTGSATTSKCAIDGVGWILCPALNFIASITDETYKLVNNFLKVSVALVDQSSGTYKGWKAMRDIANTGLAIIFLIVIFSQLTGAGISNYGVKKMLPRLVVMAIVINASFYIAQLAVDVSNILGSSIKTYFDSASIFNNGSGAAGGNTFGGILDGLIGGAAVTAGVVGMSLYGGIGLFVMVVLAAVVAIAVALLVLAVRQAFIVILIVVSPLAFLAMILPNTKKWYDNWQKIFVSLLVIYPMIAIVFGASKMASGIIAQDKSIPGILALAVATVPLFAVIPMIKGSLNAVPIAGKLASSLANRTSLGGNVSSRLKQARANFGNDMRSRALGVQDKGPGKAIRWLGGGRERGVARNRRFASSVAREEALYGATQAIKNSPNIADRAAATAALHKIEEEEIANIITLDSANGGVPPKQLLERLRSKTASSAEKIAAVRQIEARGGMTNRLEMAKITSEPILAGDASAEVRQSIVASTAKMGESNPSYGGGSLVDMQDGKFNATTAHVKHVASNQFSARSLLAMHPVAREELLAAVENAGDEASKAALASVRKQIDDNPDLAARADRELKVRIDRAIAGKAKEDNTLQVRNT